MDYVHFDAEDLNKNNLLAALGCLIFPIPLIFCPKSALGRFCANQGLILLLVSIAVALVFSVLKVLLGWIPLVGLLVRLIGWLARAAVHLAMLYLAWKTYCRQPVRLVNFVLIH